MRSLLCKSLGLRRLSFILSPWLQTESTKLVKFTPKFQIVNFSSVRSSIDSSSPRDPVIKVEKSKKASTRKKSFTTPLSSVTGDDHIKKEVGVVSVSKAVVKWTDSETATLRELVTKQLQPVWSDAASAMVTPKTIDWSPIGQQLSRLPRNCYTKWKSIEFENKGHFTAEEDTLILQRVKEYGDKGKDTWTGLSKELLRSTSALRGRWLILCTDKVKTIRWTDQMNTALVNAYDIEKLNKRGASWETVSVRLTELGWGISAQQCASRYHYILRKQASTTVVWTAELVQSLKDMRAQGMRWVDIGTALHITPYQQCTTKWVNEQKKLLKKGPFTPEEDAFIRKKVMEYGVEHRKGRMFGFWVELEKEMGRNASSIWNHWFQVLFHKE